jgi:3-oxoacyl-[acyl-carrier-protein] synthase II
VIVAESAVITGIGAVSAAGCGVDTLRAAFAGEGAERSDVDRSAGYHLSTSARTAFLVDDADLKDLIPPLVARRMCRPSKFAVAAAKLAVDEAGLREVSAYRVAVVISTSYGPSMITEKLIRQILQEGPEATSPALFTESVANAPAARVALALGARGANITITQRQAGALMALARGSVEVLSGRAEVALVGAVDEVTPLLHAILDRFGALARPCGSRAELARPFDRQRNGFTVGEGCTMLTVEKEDAAVARDARILARVRMTGRAFDPQAPPTDWGHDPGVLARALRSSLEEGHIPSTSIDGIVCGGSGSRSGDRLEALVIEESWGGRQPPDAIVPKAYLGEHGGALLAGAVLAMSGVRFGPTPGIQEVDPELSLAPYDGRELSLPARVLVTSFAPGGASSWVVLERRNR